VNSSTTSDAASELATAIIKEQLISNHVALASLPEIVQAS